MVMVLVVERGRHRRLALMPSRARPAPADETDDEARACRATWRRRRRSPRRPGARAPRDARRGGRTTAPCRRRSRGWRARRSTAMAVDDSSQPKPGATWNPQPSRESTPMMSSVIDARTPAEIDRPQRRPIGPDPGGHDAFLTARLYPPSWHSVAGPAPRAARAAGASERHADLAGPGSADANDSKEREGAKAETTRFWANGIESAPSRPASAPARSDGVTRCAARPAQGRHDTLQNEESSDMSEDNVGRGQRMGGWLGDYEELVGHDAGDAKRRGEPAPAGTQALEPGHLPLRLLRRELREPGDDPPPPRAPRRAGRGDRQPARPSRGRTANAGERARKGGAPPRADRAATRARNALRPSS